MRTMMRLAAASVLLLAASGARADDTVNVGWTPSTPMVPFLVAVDKGYYKELGIAVDIEAFRGAMDAMSMLATGRLDVDLGGVTAGFFNGVARGVDVRVVAPLAIQPPAPGSSPLIARTDLWDAGTIRTAADLKGRKVAVNASGNGIDYKLSLILASAGMTLHDVDLTKVRFPEMVTALKTKGIDAAVVAEPFATVAKMQKLGVVMMKESSAGEGDVNTAVLFSSKFIREHRATAVRFLQGLRAGMLDIAGDKWRAPENVAITTKYIKIKPDILLASVFPVFDPSLAIENHVASLERQEAMHIKNGFIHYAKPLDPARYVDASLAKEARETMPALKRH
jgi:NitT/TauT family transport system substrate-binding protein